ncbi:MAG: xylulokinase [Phycisphaerales bacterium]|nr:xylulokinase [Phycisphaerales bacterium]
MAAIYLGIDVGTSGTKALLIDGRGKVLATATAGHDSLYPRPGWSEQRPDDWWKSACSATRAVLRKSRRDGTEVAAVGLSGQMHGSVFLDARGRVLHNALLWNDQRTGVECAEIERRAGGRTALIRMVQNIALTGYTAPKVLWLRKHHPRTFKQVRTILLPKDYVNFRLTDALCCEVSDASGTLLFDVVRRTWSTKLLDKLGLDAALLPPVVESSAVIGTLTAAAARATGLAAGTPVVGGAGDQAAAAVGCGVVRRGVVSATMGTSGVVFAHSEAPVPNEAGLLQSFCHAVPGAWCVFGCMLAAGGSLQWAREVFCADALRKARTPAERDALYTTMITEAATAPDSALLFHPYLTGERCPYPHPHAVGAFIGLRRDQGRGALLRAVLEGITLGMGRQIKLMRELGVPIREVRLAGGGARNAWWRQLQADVYGVRCAVMQSEEGSALGAALLAAVGGGGFRTVPAASAAAAQIAAEHRPDARRHKYYANLSVRQRVTYESLEPLYRP